MAARREKREASLDSARPTTEEMISPHRTIRNYKTLILTYQREQILYAKTLDYLNRELARLEQSVSPDAATASGRLLRSAARRLLRRVSKAKADLDALRAGRKLGGQKAGKLRKRHGENTRARVLEMAKRLGAGGKDQRNIASIISQATNISVSQVRRIQAADKCRGGRI